MDFEEIDSILGDSVGKGDILLTNAGDYHQVQSVQDDISSIVLHTYNLSTGDDEDFILIEPSDSVKIFRSY